MTLLGNHVPPHRSCWLCRAFLPSADLANEAGDVERERPNTSLGDPEEQRAVSERSIETRPVRMPRKNVRAFLVC